MNTELQGVIAHMRTVHHAMGLAIAAGDFVSVLEHTGDMELLAGKAAQDARVSAELQDEHDRSCCAYDRREEDVDNA